MPRDIQDESAMYNVDVYRGIQKMSRHVQRYDRIFLDVSKISLNVDMSRGIHNMCKTCLDFLVSVSKAIGDVTRCDVTRGILYF